MSIYYQQAIDRPSKPIDFNASYDKSGLKDLNVLITGGSTGIGQASVKAYAEAGAYVTIVDVNEKDAEETTRGLTDKGLKVQFVKADVLSWSSLVTAFKSSLEFGPNKTVDIVIPAAGIGGELLTTWLENPTVDESGDPKVAPRAVLSVNFDGVWNTTHLAMYYFKQFPGKKEIDKQIIFVASMAGYSSMTGALGYCTSKWAVRGLFRSLRGAQKVLGEDKPVLKCNMIAPGYIKTPMTKEFHELEAQGKMRMGTVEEVADVILRLSSDKSIIARSVSVNAGVNFDLGDDPDGLDAGEALGERRKAWLRSQPEAKVPDSSEANKAAATNGDAQ